MNCRYIDRSASFFANFRAVLTINKESSILAIIALTVFLGDLHTTHKADVDDEAPGREGFTRVSRNIYWKGSEICPQFQIRLTFAMTVNKTSDVNLYHPASIHIPRYRCRIKSIKQSSYLWEWIL